MQTESLKADDAGFARAAQILRSGGLVGMPTETVYGLAANALNGKAAFDQCGMKPAFCMHPLAGKKQPTDTRHHKRHWLIFIPRQQNKRTPSSMISTKPPAEKIGRRTAYRF